MLKPTYCDAMNDHYFIAADTALQAAKNCPSMYQKINIHDRFYQVMQLILMYL
jgi:hypothetical protein